MKGFDRLKFDWRRFFQRVLQFLKAVIGDVNYQPPAWTKRAQARFSNTRVGQWSARQRTKLNENPKRTAKIVGATIAALAIAWVAYDQITKYLDSLPKPDYVTVEVRAPREPDLETNKPQNLSIVFSSSAAKIDQLDKPLPKGVELSPAIKGSWKWIDDRELVFTPSEHWQIGRKYEVELSRDLFPNHVLLKELEYEFATPELTGRITKEEFYQDPREASIKQAVYNVSYNYPLDTEDFKKRLTLTLQPKDDAVLKERAKKITFTVTFGKHQNEAFIVSENIPIPRADSVAKLEIAEGVRAARGGAANSKIESSVDVPGIFERFKFQEPQVTFARNEKFEPEQILILNTKAELPTETIAKTMKLWLFPKFKKGEEKDRRYSYWSSASEVTPEVRAKLEPVAFKVVPATEENSFRHTFKIDVPVGRFLLVEVPAGLKSYGGYELLKKYDAVVTFPDYPRELMIMSQGALLSLSGDKKIPLLGRNLDKVNFKLFRILPTQLNQFIHNNYRYEGQFAKPEFGNIQPETLSEIFNEEQTVPFVSPAKTQYFSLDLEPYLNREGGSKKGLFYMSVGDKTSGMDDQRLVLLTDLGVIVKEMNDRTHSVFVQHLRSGAPVNDAEVEVMGLNGIAVMSKRTGPDGRVTFPDLSDYKNEKKPLAFVVKKDGDVAFLPYQMTGRRLTYSQFDTGGLYESSESDELTAYLFSDRGIYRPGDTVNMGLMVRSRNWKTNFNNLPVSWAVTDARGTEVVREKIEVGSNDLHSLSFPTQDTWATGVYNIQVFITKNDKTTMQIGSLSVRVEEFLPDRLRISASLSGAKPQGWISPNGIKGQVSLKNLFGTPAENRRVKAELVLNPTRPSFKAYKDFDFSVLRGDEKSFTETLQPTTTNEAGEAEFDLDLSRFATGMYLLRLDVEGYEANGGRAVSASTSTLVSARPYLVGIKTGGSLNYLAKGSDRSIEIIAVDPELKKVAAPGLQLILVERRYVSALMQQPDGTYRYQSVLKELAREPKPFELKEKGASFKIPTNEPGDFVAVIKDKDGIELNRVAFSVAGSANLSRSLEKNAELQVTLNKQDYGSGEEIEMQIKAPYTGAGLITIERDKVYAVKWFKTSTTSTVERIKIPEGLEGNAFVNVTFLRAIDSKEIFMSPLSYAVMPFSISLDDHKIALKLDAPAIVKPGEKLKVSYSASKRTKLILYGVDEGILQVAKYKLPDPLTYFFQRRALQVKTFQLLDLLLPEYSVVQSLAAPGGDEGGGALAKNLNPFKRKTDKPVAFWSGVIEAGSELKEFTYEVPDYFNGNIKVMAVASNGPAFGSAEQGVLSRGDFIITSNIPTFVVPGDEFEVGVGLSNQAEGTGEKAQVKLELTAEAFEVVGEPMKTLAIPEGREGSASFRLRARNKLGSQPIRFRASGSGSAGAKSAKASVETSIRPAVPYMTSITGGMAEKASFEIPVARKLLPEFRKQTAGVSPLPLVMGDGLRGFLDAYPYGCSEQLTSKTFPFVLLKNRSEFKIDAKKANEFFNSTLSTLRTRQLSDGSFAMYDPSGGTNAPATLYVTHLLVEAKERGFNVPEDVLDRALSYLESQNVRETGSIEQARMFAYALYLRARSGRVPGNDLSFLHKALATNHKDMWAQDLAAGWLAATYKIIKKDDEARAIFSKLKVGQNTRPNYDYFYDGFQRDTALIYLGARHFPELIKELANDKGMKTAFAPLSRGSYNTHSAAFSLLALDALVSSAAKPENFAQMKIEELQAKGVAKVLPLPSNSLMPTVEFSDLAQKIRYGVPENLPFYYIQTQAGFDTEMPKEVIQKKLEVTREYLDANGKTITSAKMGDEVKVRLRVRSHGDDRISNIVIVDLLPSGLEPILEPVEVASESEEVHHGDLPERQRRHYDEEEGSEGEMPPPYDPQDFENSEEGSEGAAYPFLKMFLPKAFAEEASRAIASVAAALQTDYVDRREDRMIIYATATKDITEYVYRAKAVSQGTFVVPPAFAESMYDRDVQYRGVGSSFKVEAP